MTTRSRRGPARCRRQEPAALTARSVERPLRTRSRASASDRTVCRSGNSDASASAGSIASKFRSGRAPARSSARTVCSSPKAVATTSAVRPVPVRASLDAPRAKSSRTTSAAPWRAATCVDVRRRAGVASTAWKGLIYAAGGDAEGRPAVGGFLVWVSSSTQKPRAERRVAPKGGVRERPAPVARRRLGVGAAVEEDVDAAFSAVDHGDD